MLTVEAALAALSAPTPTYEMMAAHHRFYKGPFGRWHDAVTDAGRKPDRKTAAKLTKLLGDVLSPPLRHYLAETHEHLDVGEEGLALALRAAACTPAWDPVFVAWSLRGVAFWLRKLGRLDEARAVVAQLWQRDPFYEVGREEAAELGMTPPAEPTVSGVSDQLRLAGYQALVGDFRPPHLRHIAMAMSLVWNGDFAAGARMAALAGKGTKTEGSWAARVQAFAESQAKRRGPGDAAPLPDGMHQTRHAAIAPALAAGDLGLLRALALDPNRQVMLAAWAALGKAGEAATMRPLLVEMYRALDVRPASDFRLSVGAVLNSMPR